MDNRISQNQFLARMKAAKDSINKFQNLPCATYFCLLKEVKYAPSKSGKEMVTFIYKVLEGDYRNREHRNFYMIGSDSEVPFNMLIQDIANLGYPIDEITSLEAMLSLFEQITNDRLHVQIRISENPDPQYAQYVRTRIEEVVEVTDVEESSGIKPASPASPATEEPATDVKPSPAEGAVPQQQPPHEDEDGIEEEGDDAIEEEEHELDIGTKIQFEFKGKTMEGVVESGSADGLTAIVLCTDNKKRKVKCEKILKILK